MQSTSRWITLVSLFLALGAHTFTRMGSAAEGIDAGPEIWVNGPGAVDFSGDDLSPDVAVDELGRRIYVWSNAFPVNPQRSDIILRRFGADETPLEDPRIINFTSDSDQKWPRVAVSGDGSFLVIWQSFEDDNGTARFWVRSQAFDTDGQPVGLEQLLSTVSTGSGVDAHADVAALRKTDGSGGGYAVTWSSFNATGDDNSSASIEMRLVSATGVPQGPQMQVNTTIAGVQEDPAIAELPDGGFLVEWMRPGIRGRRFDAAGASPGNDFPINTEFSGSFGKPDAAIGWDGVMAVVWADHEGSGNPQIRARLFDSSLAALGPDFRVNTLDTGANENPRVADHGPKGFLVVWEAADSIGTDTDLSIQARLVTAHNTFDGPQIQYNVWEPGDQETPAAHGWYGRLGSSWLSFGNNQTTGRLITGRHIEYCLYCDDFEWGSGWRWSRTEE